jgi:hypothetical protein
MLALWCFAGAHAATPARGWRIDEEHTPSQTRPNKSAQGDHRSLAEIRGADGQRSRASSETFIVSCAARGWSKLLRFLVGKSIPSVRCRARRLRSPQWVCARMGAQTWLPRLRAANEQ